MIYKKYSSPLLKVVRRILLREICSEKISAKPANRIKVLNYDTKASKTLHSRSFLLNEEYKAHIIG